MSKELNAIRFQLVETMGYCPLQETMDGFSKMLRRLPPPVFDFQPLDGRPRKGVVQLWKNYIKYFGPREIEWLMGSGLIAAVRDDRESIYEVIRIALTHIDDEDALSQAKLIIGLARDVCRFRSELQGRTYWIPRMTLSKQLNTMLPTKRTHRAYVRWYNEMGYCPDGRPGRPRKTNTLTRL
jgi:hypothetical protein